MSVRQGSAPGPAFKLKRAEDLGLDATFLMDRADLAGDAGRARADGLITHRFRLDDYAGALDALRGDRTVHKIVIECWPD